VQQIHYIVREIAHGKSTFDRRTRQLLGVAGAGTLALVTAFVSFITLILIPIRWYASWRSRPRSESVTRSSPTGHVAG